MANLKERSLTLYAFEISPEHLPQYPLYKMDFPVEWITFLKAIDDTFGYKVRLSNLRLKLQSLFPQILCGYDNPLTRQSPGPWLIAVEEIPVEWIRRFTISWLKEQLINKKYLEQADSIPEVELKWSDYKLPEVWDDGIRYNLLPGLFAYDLCSQSREITIAGHHLTLDFVHVFYGKKHECMTLPSTDKKRAFSYVIRFSVITRGGQADRTILKVHIGMRRFLFDTIDTEKSLKYSSEATLLLAICNPFVKAKPGKITLSKVSFKKYSNGSNASVKWTTSIDTLFMYILNKEIKIEDVLADPKGYAREGESIQGFLVYNNRAYTQEPYVKAGLGLPERIELLELVKRTWNLNQVHLAGIPEISTRKKAKLDRFPVQYSQKALVKVEFWMSEEMFHDCIQTLTEPVSHIPALLLQTEKENEYILYCNQNVTVHVTNRDNLALVQELQQDGWKEKRVREIVKSIEKAPQQSITLAVIEIGKKSSYQKNDPKDAVRLGLSKTGRLSQFIYRLDKIEHNLESLTDHDKNRIVNAFLDLLADAGFYRANLVKVLDKENLVAVDIIQRNVKQGQSRYPKIEYLPVLIWFNEGRILVKRKGDRQWLSLREALLDYSSAYPLGSGKNLEKGEQLLNWLEQELEAILLSTKNTMVYLFADAGLRWRFWEEFKNDKIKSSSLPLRKSLFQDSRLRIIRLNHTDDVPQYDILKYNRNGRINHDKGLFRDGELYYSVGSRPDTMQQKTMITKHEKPEALLLKQQAVEIYPTGVLNEEEADSIAILTHLLREGNLTYKFSTAQPFPLHLMQSIEKYWKIQVNSNEDGGLGNEFADDSLIKGEFDDTIIKRLRLMRRYGYGVLRIK